MPARGRHDTTLADPQKKSKIDSPPRKGERTEKFHKKVPKS